MPIGLRVVYYERSDDLLKGPYPAFISSYNSSSQLANLRVFIEDSFSLYDLKNVPFYNAGTEQTRFWAQNPLFSSSRFQKIADMLEDPSIETEGVRVKSEFVKNKHGAFLKMLNEDGCEEKEIYISPGQGILIRQN